MRRIRPSLYSTVSYSHLPSWASSIPTVVTSKYVPFFSRSLMWQRIRPSQPSRSFTSTTVSSLSMFPTERLYRQRDFRRYGLWLVMTGIGGTSILLLQRSVREEDEARGWGWTVRSKDDNYDEDNGNDNHDHYTYRIGSTKDSVVENMGTEVSTFLSDDRISSLLPSWLSSSSSSSSSSSFTFLARDNIDDEIQRMINDAFGTPSSSSSASPPPPLPPPSPVLPSVRDTLPPGKLTVATIIGLNTLVWGLWQLPSDSIARLLPRWFLTSPVHMGSGVRGYTSLFLSTYSHKSFFHLLANMVGLWSFGPILMMGRHTVQRPRLSVGEFLSLYTVGGVLASLGSNLFMASLRLPRPGLGASGSIFAILTYFTLAFPESRMLLFFFINTSAYTALGAATGINLYLVFAEIRAARTGRPGPTFDGMAHLVGTVVGAAWFYAARARARRKGVPDGGSGSLGRYGGGVSGSRGSGYGGGGSMGGHHRPGSGSDIDV